jgi:hypothetical protein
MLAVMDWNSTRDAELSGERKVIRQRRVPSKAKGGDRLKVEKTSGSDAWKRDIVMEAVERKSRLGPGIPDLEDDEEDEEIDADAQIIEQLTTFDSDEEEREE